MRSLFKMFELPHFNILKNVNQNSSNWSTRVVKAFEVSATISQGVAWILYNPSGNVCKHCTRIDLHRFTRHVMCVAWYSDVSTPLKRLHLNTFNVTGWLRLLRQLLHMLQPDRRKCRTNFWNMMWKSDGLCTPVEGLKRADKFMNIIIKQLI